MLQQECNIKEQCDAYRNHHAAGSDSQQHEIMRMVEEIADLGHWTLNVNTGEIFWSDAIYRIHGVTPEDYSPQLDNAVDFYHPEDREIVYEALEHAKRTGSAFDFRLRIIGGDGVLRYVRSKGKTIKDASGNTNMIFGVFQDVTALEKATRELDDMKHFSQLIMDNNPDYVFVKDEEFKIVKANKAFLRNYPEEQRDKVIGYTTLEDYQPDEVDIFLKMDKKAFKEGISDTMETISFPDDSTKILHTRKIRFENKEGECFILGLSSDVTERERLVENLRVSNEELSRFAYICSHDMQEPLRMISSFTQRLEKHLEAILEEDEKAAKYFHFVKDGAFRGQQLIKDILEYSRLDKDIELHEFIDLQDMVVSILNDFSVTIEEKGAITEVGKLPVIKANRSQMYQLFLNLISNGLKYQQKDASPELRITAERIKNNWHFYIKDNGIGIEPRHHHVIFDVFKRLHGRSEYSGTGIGLAICKKIVESSGGMIEVISDIGKGTTMHFTLPATMEVKSQ